MKKEIKTHSNIILAYISLTLPKNNHDTTDIQLKPCMPNKQIFYVKHLYRKIQHIEHGTRSRTTHTQPTAQTSYYLGTSCTQCRRCNWRPCLGSLHVTFGITLRCADDYIAMAIDRGITETEAIKFYDQMRRNGQIYQSGIVNGKPVYSKVYDHRL